MNTVRSILLHLGASGRTATPVAVASALAEQLDATVSATHAVIPSVVHGTAARAVTGRPGTAA